MRQSASRISVVILSITVYVDINNKKLGLISIVSHPIKVVVVAVIDVVVVNVVVFVFAFVAFVAVVYFS